MLITASARHRLLPSAIRLLSTASQGAPAHEDYDVVIVGGGPAGLALAGALGQHLHLLVLHLISSSTA